MMRPLRPSLKFIATLPTLKIKEEVETSNMVIWKVELDKPVDILTSFSFPSSTMTLSTFYIGAITLERFSQEKGWQYDMKIGIKRDLKSCDFMIGPRGEGWYLDHKWWKFSG